MNQMCGYLAANLTVAANLRLASDAAAEDAAWPALQARARAIGCQLSPCYLDPSSDGSCNCGPGLMDREGVSISNPETGDPYQDLDLAWFTMLVEKLEKNGGVHS